MTVGERISQLRKEKDISQVQLAKLLDVSRQAVSKWENDQNMPDTLKLIQIADVLDTDVEYLATGKHTVLRRPAQVITVEKIVEKPVETIVEKPVIREKIVEVEKIVETVVEKPVVRKVVRTRYLRNPVEFVVIGIGCFLVGILVGLLL